MRHSQLQSFNHHKPIAAAKRTGSSVTPKKAADQTVDDPEESTIITDQSFI